MNEGKRKRKYKGKPTGWSKSKDREQMDSPNKENPSQEDDMNEEETQALIDRSNEKMIDMLNKKFGGNTPPGGDKMDQDTKDYLEKLTQGVARQGEMLEKLFGEQQQKENEKRFGELIEEQIKPVKDAYDGLSKKIGRVEKLVCNEDGTVCFFTKEELENWKKEQAKELEKAKGEAKKIPEEKPNISQFSNKELYSRLIESKTAVEDLEKVHIAKVLEDPNYRAKVLDTLCDPKNEQCRVDVMEKFNKFSEQEEETEKKEKTKEGKHFLLSKK